MDNKFDTLKITENDISTIFEIKSDRLYLKNSKSRSIKNPIPLILDENMAKISAMLLDGCIKKDFCTTMFCQKKDKNKVIEFSTIIKGLFGLKPKFVEFNNNSPGVTFCSKTLGVFLNRFVNIHKSDETARIPKWIWDSPKSVVIEYLRYAFAMEGSISDYKQRAEIRFHSVDFPYIEDLKNILKSKFDINSNIQKYYIKNYGWKYYLCISKQTEIIKFQEIGFALGSHQARLIELVNSFKNKAWEITLIEILKIYGQGTFTLNEACKINSFLCKSAIHHRLCDLIKLKYLQKTEFGYSLTKIGYDIAMTIKENVKFAELRTNPKQNEEKVFKFLLNKRESYRNEIARQLQISPITVRETLKRLMNQQKIKLTRVDKFQRRFYRKLF